MRRSKKKLKEGLIVGILFGISFLLRVFYIIYTPHHIRQHDSYLTGSDGGHLAYIEHFLKNGFAMPDFDPRLVEQFYHPPLHHFLAALWLKANSFIGIDYLNAVENIQILTLLYSCACTWICYLIMKEFYLVRLGLIIPFSIICFHPTLIILSGSINNDILCLLLMLSSILFAIRWYKRPSIVTILLTAVYLGLAIMTKMSGLLIVIPIGLLFLCKIIQEKQYYRKYLFQCLVFGLVCFSIGMWRSIYCLVEYGMPINYILRLGEGAQWQFIGNYSIWERVFVPDLHLMESIFVLLNPVNDYNILLGALKTSMFGEYFLYQNNPSLLLPATVLFYCNIILVITSLICILWALKKKNISDNMFLNWFLFSTFMIIFGSYFKFCLDFPHICTQDFRYIAITFMIGTFFLGFFINTIQNKQSLWSKAVLYFVLCNSLIFCIGSFCTYILLGL